MFISNGLRILGKWKDHCHGVLASNLPGERLYIGGKILDIMRSEGLPETRESERQVRLKLRERDGMAAFALMERGRIIELLSAGRSVVIDAVFSIEEVDFLRGCAGPHSVRLIGITSSFEKRCDRLAVRPTRPLTAEDLRKRDQKECDTLGLPIVMRAVDIIIENNDSIESYKQKLGDLVLAL